MKNISTKTLAQLVAATTVSLFGGCAGMSPHDRGVAYPLKECLVSGNELGSMGDVVTEVYEGREIKFCCKPCVKKFHADPERYLAKLPRQGSGKRN